MYVIVFFSVQLRINQKAGQKGRYAYQREFSTINCSWKFQMNNEWWQRGSNNTWPTLAKVPEFCSEIADKLPPLHGCSCLGPLSPSPITHYNVLWCWMVPSAPILKADLRDNNKGFQNPWVSYQHILFGSTLVSHLSRNLTIPSMPSNLL